MFNKHKFTANPQQDSEGFTDYQAVCVGCGPNEPCWRSGHCERYDSPLRFIEPVVLTVDVAAMVEAHEAARESNTLHLEDGRSMPYCAQCKCWHFPSAGHAADIEVHAHELHTAHIAELDAWLRRGRSVDVATAPGLPIVELPNPAGWNEPGMQTIADYGWAELEERALLNDTPLDPAINTGRVLRNGRAE